MVTRGRSVRFARNYNLAEKSYSGKKARKRNEVLPPFSIPPPRVNPSHAFLFNVEESTQRDVQRRKIEKSKRCLGKSQVAERQNNKENKNSQIPSQDLMLIILKVLCCHLTKVSLTMVVRFLLDYLYALLYLIYQAGSPCSIPACVFLFEMDYKKNVNG